MTTKYLTVRLTLAEAQELMNVAGNGYGDGDFYGMNDDGRNGTPRPGLGKEYRTYCRAHYKMESAIREASNRGS